MSRSRGTRTARQLAATPQLGTGQPCCGCCVAAHERGELNHVLHGGCPYPPCDWCGK